MLLPFILVALLGAAPPAPEPTPTPTAEPLPAIGRVSTRSAACVAMHDLTIPAFAATLRANKTFDETAPLLAKYAESSANDATGVEKAARDMYRHRMGSALATMQQDLLTVAKALGDPKLAPDPDRPDVTTEHDRLQNMYNAQMDRVNVLFEYLTRESNSEAQKELADNGAFKRGNTPNLTAPQALATATPLATDRTLFGQPQISKEVGFVAKREMAEWTSGMATQVKLVTNDAAKAFLPIAKGCPP